MKGKKAPLGIKDPRSIGGEGQGAGENRPPEEGKGDAGLLGMTLGMCLGAALGVAMDNISMWITMGMMVGLMLGMVLGRKQE